MTEDLETGRKCSLQGRCDSASRRPYAPPAVEPIGSVHDTVLGPSPGLGESGNPTVLFAGSEGTGSTAPPPPPRRNPSS